MNPADARRLFDALRRGHPGGTAIFDRDVSRYSALERYRPDLAKRVAAGTLEMRDAIGVMKRQWNRRSN